MVRVLLQGMRELGLDPDAAATLSAGPMATVPLDDKRRIVGSALAQGGIGCLALLGRGLHRLAHEPTHAALVSARDAQDLFTRWSRLERYIHSRHRIEVLAVDDRSATLQHVSLSGSPPPQAAEDLVVLGVILALLEAMGATQVSARIGEGAVYPEPDASALALAAQAQRTGTWSLSWSITPRCASGTTPNPTPQPTHAPQTWPAIAQRCFQALAADLMNPPSLPQLAQALGEAPRSLQRQLGRAGLSYTQILAEARCSAASSWLMATATPMAEIGFVCGYADQPHFTRDFKQRVGLTPQRYRREFGHRP